MALRRIADAWMETHNSRTIRFDFRDAPVEFKPGQFVVVADQFRGYAKPVRRAYSIASSPLQRDFLDLTVKREAPGLMSTRLTEVPVGTMLDVAEPAGKYLYEPARGKRVLLLGAGSGITPLHSIARYILESRLPDAEVMLFYSVKTPKDVIYERAWPELVRQYPNFKFHLTATRAKPAEWPGRCGRISAAWVREACGDVGDCVAYICGPGPMVETMEAICAELGLPESRVNTEKW